MFPSFINLGIGVITTAPALNIFAVGFPAMILAGIILLSISMTSIAYRFSGCGCNRLIP